MIVVVQQHNAHLHADIIDQMFRLRTRVFRDRLKWDLKVVDGRERDKYDEEGPVYLIHTDEAGINVRGSLRLLPTTGPTLLVDIFSDTLPDGVRLSAPTIWECTRFCIDDRTFGKNNRDQMLLASGTLIAGLGRVALNAGIETILGNFDPTMLKIYRRIGCNVEVLGCTYQHGQAIYLGAFPISEAIIKQVQDRLAMMHSVRLGQDSKRNRAA